MPVLRNKKTGPGMMPGRLAVCSLRGRKRALLKLDDGVQAVPGHACGQRDFVLGSFLFKLGGFSVSTAVHDDGRFCEFLADVLDEERFGAFQLFSLLSNQRADMQVDGFFAAPVRLVDPSCLLFEVKPVSRKSSRISIYMVWAYFLLSQILNH